MSMETGEAQPQSISNENKKNSNMFYIPSLDGIRAIAILIVFLSHAGLGGIIPGGLGVTTFFFLSGYLITTLLRREYEKNNFIDFSHFYMRRMLRIWPNFYLVLFTGSLLTVLGAMPGQISWMPFIAQVLQFTNYYSIYHGGMGTMAGSGVFWSLAVEEHFYFLFPFLYLILLRLGLTGRQQFLTLILLCLAILAWRYYLVTVMGGSETRIYYASDTRFDSILFGCALGVYKNPKMDYIDSSDKRLKYVHLPLALLLLFFTLIYRSELFRETLRYSLQGIALYTLFVIAIRFPQWGVIRLLNHRWARFAGTLSYSFYLIHFSVITSIGYWFKGKNVIMLSVVSFFCSFLLAYIIYIAVEIPLSRYRRKLSS
ncbi:MAG: acyltransferase family protein [Sulfuriferula sp.]